MDKKFAIFDLDGTLIDSMPAWQTLSRDYLQSKGITLEENAKADDSTSIFDKTFKTPGNASAMAAELNQMIENQYRNTIPLKPGAADYLRALKAQGVRLCVSTAISEELARACLTRLGVDGLFDFIISCEVIGIGKNRPNVFHLAAKKLGAPPADIAIYEDATFAIKTAKQAGFYTIGVYDASVEISQQKARALCDEYIVDYRDRLNNPTTVSTQLYESVRSIWKLYYTHPFLTGIADGTLPLERFRYFIIQEYLFLFEYARIYAIGLTKARTPSLMRHFSSGVNRILNGDIFSMRSYLRHLDLDEHEIIKTAPALANAAYTSFMQSIASRGSIPEILAVLLASTWSYSEICSRLSANFTADTHSFYADWMKCHKAVQQQKITDTLIALVNEYTLDSTEEEVKSLTNLFAQCSRFQLNFWNMAWNMEP